MKKITMGLGAIASTVAPIVAVVSCGETPSTVKMIAIAKSFKNTPSTLKTIPTEKEYNKILAETKPKLEGPQAQVDTLTNEQQARLGKIGGPNSPVIQIQEKIDKGGWATLSDDEKKYIFNAINQIAAIFNEK